MLMSCFLSRYQKRKQNGEIKKLCGCFLPKEFSFSEGENVEKNVEKEKEQEPVLEVGKWVLVEYDAELFPGAITQIVGDQYEVDTMNCAGENKFYIPSIRFDGEKVWYYRDDIKCIIPEPLPATSSARHFSVVPEIWAQHRKKRV
ncbi:hypothetical protein SKAU_G00178920 [Synaphobranchus kaupii]|uniref:Uncharacterized protein n=1 Tax=Synaphobranchus kaupii TaxID=118154 RepID=A0A9Q1J1K7_SYNKA|nr:hypothetical protein SKAU_G00178920 [Synaphobranchus kaupii]